MGSFAKKFSHMKLNVYHDDSIGDRKYMEDIVLIAANNADGCDELCKSRSPFACFFIFDGHGGAEAAKFARNTLLSQLLAQENFHSDNDEDVVSSIKQGFIKTQELMLKDSVNWPKSYNGRMSTSGTTVSMVMIRKKKMFVAHVGDSRVVLGEKVEHGWKPVVLTEDHKPDDPKELKRIRDDGGDVICRNGVPRVVWKRKRLLRANDETYDLVPFLAVSRSLGDFWSYNPERSVYTVSPEPDVSVHDLDPKMLGCIIMASDGLWNVMKTEMAMEFVHLNCTSENISNCASELVNDTISSCALRKLKADNTSIIIICPKLQESDCEHDDNYFTVNVISNSTDLKSDILNKNTFSETPVSPVDDPEQFISKAKDESVHISGLNGEPKPKDLPFKSTSSVPVLEPLTESYINKMPFENGTDGSAIKQFDRMSSEEDNETKSENLHSDINMQLNDSNNCMVHCTLKTEEVKHSLCNGKMNGNSSMLDMSFDYTSAFSESQQLISSPFGKLNLSGKSTDARSLKRKSKSYSGSDAKKARWVSPGSSSYTEGCNGRAPLETLQVCS